MLHALCSSILHNYLFHRWLCLSIYRPQHTQNQRNALLTVFIARQYYRTDYTRDAFMWTVRTQLITVIVMKPAKVMPLKFRNIML